MIHFFKKKELEKTVVYACARGQAIALSEVQDPVFSQKLMGDGIAILIEEDTIYAPAEGTISVIAKTLHAIGMTLSSGVEVMIHVGLETVSLNGQGFTLLCEVGQHVHQGDPLLKIDIDFMKQKAIQLYTPIIILDQKEKTLTQRSHPLLVDKNTPLLELL